MIFSDIQKILSMMHFTFVLVLFFRSITCFLRNTILDVIVASLFDYVRLRKVPVNDLQQFIYVTLDVSHDRLIPCPLSTLSLVFIRLSKRQDYPACFHDGRSRHTVKV